MNQTNGIGIQDESLKEDFKKKWNKYEVVEREVHNYTFRIRIALGFLILGFLSLFVLAFIPPNENPIGFVSGVFVVMALLGVSTWIFSNGIVTVNKVYPYDPEKTQEWRKKQKEEKLMEES
jgi:hypothetical protein